MKYSSIFITATDTEVGKTITTYALALQLRQQGLSVGVLKPVQCSGDDAAFLKKQLNLDDSLDVINPCYAPEPLSPHLALKRSNLKFSLSKVKKSYQQLKNKYDIVLIEGAGGLMVPLTPNYFVLDLIKDLEANAIVVSRLGLGTINHTLLTVNQLQHSGIDVRGVVFSDKDGGKKSVSQKTNPDEINKIADTNVLGIVPKLKSFSAQHILRDTSSLNIKPLLQKDRLVTKRLQSDDKEYLWHSFTQMRDWIQENPLVIDQAKGSYLIDSDGNKYLDGVSSLWVTTHGHRQKDIDQAIKKQIDKVSHSTLLGLSNTPAIELSKKLVQITPKGLDKVFYSDNGSTSVEIAIKMAYQYWQNIGKTKKTDIVHLENSYHGDTLGSVSVGGIGLFHQVYKKLIFKTIKLDFKDPYRYPNSAKDMLKSYEDLLKQKSNQIAAIVVEPLMQGAAGMFKWPKGVLKQLRQLCTKYNVFLICDEVATGFGRTGKMFACEHENVSPDFLCVSKGLTGGYLPLAATITSKKVYDGFVFDYKDMKTFFHGHTYTGNPLACAAALSNIKVFEKQRVMQKMASKIKYLSDTLKMFYNLPSVGDIRQLGFMVGIELVKDKATKEAYPWQEKIGVQICQKVRKYGVILRPLGNVIVLMPPLSISKAELKILLDSTYKAIADITQSKT